MRNQMLNDQAMTIAKELHRTFKSYSPHEVNVFTNNAFLCNMIMTEQLGKERTQELVALGEEPWRLAWQYFSVMDCGDLEEIEYMANKLK